MDRAGHEGEEDFFRFGFGHGVRGQRSELGRRHEALDGLEVMMKIKIVGGASEAANEHGLEVIASFVKEIGIWHL